MSTISVRLPDSLHEAAREEAKRDNISMNQLIASALGEKLSALKTALKKIKLIFSVDISICMTNAWALIT